jgi:hypothetical protein
MAGSCCCHSRAAQASHPSRRRLQHQRRTKSLERVTPQRLRKVEAPHARRPLRQHSAPLQRDPPVEVRVAADRREAAQAEERAPVLDKDREADQAKDPAVDREVAVEEAAEAQVLDRPPAAARARTATAATPAPPRMAALPDRKVDQAVPPDRKVDQAVPPDRKVDQVVQRDRKVDQAVPPDRKVDHRALPVGRQPRPAAARRARPAPAAPAVPAARWAEPDRAAAPRADR